MNKHISIKSQSKPSVCPICRTPNSFIEQVRSWRCKDCGHIIAKNVTQSTQIKESVFERRPISRRIPYLGVICIISIIAFCIGLGIGHQKNQHSTSSNSSQSNSTSISKSTSNFIQSPIPENAVEFGNHHYMFYNSGISWSQADAKAKELGGHLATISSTEENAFILEEGKKYDVHFYWLGANSFSGTWSWVTGEEWKFTNWLPDEPSGTGAGDTGYTGEGSEIEECLAMQMQIPDYYLTRYNPPKLAEDNLGFWNDACDSIDYGDFSDENDTAFWSTKYYGYVVEWDS
ncbi:MAG: hypothetical protein LBM93_02895 [Oscillospiraceae bacterium]|nr:hypothetical protein [Oscillospiraceae bacterium]